MGNDIKSGFGYIIPAAALIGFGVALIAEEFLLAVFFASAGILVWFIYMQVMEIKPPKVMGNFIVLFTILISVGLFLAFGLKMNPHGGYEVVSEGSVLAFVILFFGIMAGILFNRSHSFDQTESDELSQEERRAVENSIRTGDSSPKIIVIKSEQKEEKAETDDPDPAHYPPSPYLYDEDYDDDDDEYEDDEDDDEYEDEYDDEYEDDDEEK